MGSTGTARAAALMVQGTTSDAGKSVVCAGLCRALVRKGCRVAPFKPQNMSLNSAVTSDGGEIGRAQALQAAACRVLPHSDMNPVLLKPSSDQNAQVIIQGRALSTLNAADFHDYKRTAMAAVQQSFDRMSTNYEVVIVEGAGSPAEINLRENDIANMGFAEAVDVPVILVADIDRGGVFAHLVGTLELLSCSEQARIQGFVINRFRGDMALLQPGIDWLEERTQKPVLGVIPYLHDLHLDAEDALVTRQEIAADADPLRVVVPVLSRVSNHTDFDPLRLHPYVELLYVPTGQPIPAADVIILPGTKNVRGDMHWLTDNGWPQAIHRHLRYGGKLIGICGGFQMLGTNISDPHGVEDAPGSTPGLGLLDFTTELMPQKVLLNVRGTLAAEQSDVSGYEIHCGVSAGPALGRPALLLEDGRPDGVLSKDDQIMGTYLHGLFDQPESCAALLRWCGLEKPEQASVDQIREAQLDRLADTLEQTLALDRLFPGVRW